MDASFSDDVLWTVFAVAVSIAMVVVVVDISGFFVGVGEDFTKALRTPGGNREGVKHLFRTALEAVGVGESVFGYVFCFFIVWHFVSVCWEVVLWLMVLWGCSLGRIYLYVESCLYVLLCGRILVCFLCDCVFVWENNGCIILCWLIDYFVK